MAEAWLYDGERAVRRNVAVEAAAQGLRVRGDGIDLAIPAEALVHKESRPDAEIFGRAEQPGWRLGIARPVPDALAQILPERRVYGRWIDRFGLAKAAAIGAALSALVLFVGYNAPAWLAPAVPSSWEERFGEALLGDLGPHVCTGEDGQKALDALAARLTPDAAGLKVRVADIGIVNAAALPGGTIVLFRELVADAESPDEVAGVLAHEIAHIERRHVTQTMLRQIGVGMIMAALGGTTGSSIDMLTSARYSRRMEAEADRDAIAMLRRAGISPRGTAGFFDRLAGWEGDYRHVGVVMSYLSSHPLSAERRDLFRSAAERVGEQRPALDQEAWYALQDICWKGPDSG